LPPANQLVEIDCHDVWKELVNYMERDLTPVMRERINLHLQECGRCRAVYDGSYNVVRLLGEKSAIELPPGFSRRLYSRFIRSQSR